MLALFDPHAPGYPKLLPVVPRLLSLLPHAVYHAAKKLPHRISKLRQSKPQPDNQNLVQIEDLADTEISIDRQRNLPQKINSFRDRLEYFSLLLLKITPWAFLVPRFFLDEGRSLPIQLQKVQEANIKAMLSYQPQVYSGKAILFRASAQPPGCYTDPQLGWGSFVAGGLEIYDIPGYHSESLLYEERSVRVLGKQLKVCLDNAIAND